MTEWRYLFPALRFVITIIRAVDILQSSRVPDVSHAIRRLPTFHCLTLSSRAVHLRPGLFFSSTLPSMLIPGCGVAVFIVHISIVLAASAVLTVPCLQTHQPVVGPRHSSSVDPTHSEHTVPHPHLKCVQVLFVRRFHIPTFITVQRRAQD